MPRFLQNIVCVRVCPESKKIRIWDQNKKRIQTIFHENNFHLKEGIIWFGNAKLKYKKRRRRVQRKRKTTHCARPMSLVELLLVIRNKFLRRRSDSRLQMIHDSITLKSESFSLSCFEEKLFLFSLKMKKQTQTNTHHIVHHGIHKSRVTYWAYGGIHATGPPYAYTTLPYALGEGGGGERERGGGERGREFVKPREGRDLGFFFLCVTFLFLFSLIQETRVEGGGASQTACIIFIL